MFGTQDPFGKTSEIAFLLWAPENMSTASIQQSVFIRRKAVINEANKLEAIKAALNRVFLHRSKNAHTVFQYTLKCLFSR